MYRVASPTIPVPAEDGLHVPLEMFDDEVVIAFGDFVSLAEQLNFKENNLGFTFNSCAFGNLKYHMHEISSFAPFRLEECQCNESERCCPSSDILDMRRVILEELRWDPCRMLQRIRLRSSRNHPAG